MLLRAKYSGQTWYFETSHDTEATWPILLGRKGTLSAGQLKNHWKKTITT